MGDRELRREAAGIEKIRSLRVREGRNPAASVVVGELRDRLEREVRQTGGMGEAWRTVAPDNLRDRARIASFRRGVLVLETGDAGTRYLVEQWLRAGGRGMLAGCAPGTITRVVVRSG